MTNLLTMIHITKCSCFNSHNLVIKITMIFATHTQSSQFVDNNRIRFVTSI